jgi:hypothetical protein
MTLRELEMPADLTYVGVFLSFRCRYACSYCINRVGGLRRREELTTRQWIDGLNRLAIKRGKKVPLTLQGGEPSRHSGFVKLIEGIDPDIYVDVLTNLDFDIDRFMRAIPPERLRRSVPYASIRVSYHPEFSDLDALIGEVARMQDRGYSIGLYAVDHPETDIETVRAQAEKEGIDFRTKEFLGTYEGRTYGCLAYEGGFDGVTTKEVECRTTELLLAPDGSIHRCHRDLYRGDNSLGSILDEGLRIEFTFRECDRFGECNPCDIKLKTNRFQQFGHCAVEIRDPQARTIHKRRNHEQRHLQDRQSQADVPPTAGHPVA